MEEVLTLSASPAPPWLLGQQVTLTVTYRHPMPQVVPPSQVAQQPWGVPVTVYYLGDGSEQLWASGTLYTSLGGIYGVATTTWYPDQTGGVIISASYDGMVATLSGSVGPTAPRWGIYVAGGILAAIVVGMFLGMKSEHLI